MLTIKPYFGEPLDDYWGVMEYDYKDQEIKVNLVKTWHEATLTNSKDVQQQFINLYTATIIHKTLHVAILSETRLWALGEELIVRKLNNETISKSIS